MSTNRKPPQCDFFSHSGAALSSIDEVTESGDPETELVPPKKNTHSGGSHNSNSNVPISAHVIAQDAQLSRALASKIPLGIFTQGPSQNLCGSEVLALKEPTKSKIGRMPKPKPSGALTSKRENNGPSGRENAAPDDSCAKKVCPL
ncbi:hypothetical protein B0H13DRAFT_1882375 [Mycena leptocephala]|nr:hypothetical protein B0H13DRAFT_1882375 [Mycena leptocephala]